MLSDLDQDPSFQIKAQILESAQIYSFPFIVACHLQIDADPVPDLAYHSDADSDPYFYLMQIRMRIQVTKLMRIRIHNTRFGSLTSRSANPYHLSTDTEGKKSEKC
jgi:hypothetical protein